MTEQESEIRRKIREAAEANMRERRYARMDANIQALDQSIRQQAAGIASETLTARFRAIS